MQNNVIEAMPRGHVKSYLQQKLKGCRLVAVGEKRIVVD
jgi:hypothetical protein